MFVHFVETGIPNNSFGNGSAIRVSYLGEYFQNLEQVLQEAEKSAIASHTHEDAIAGAKCIAGATHLAKTGANKQEILDFVNTIYDINLRTIQPSPKFEVSCSGSVPIAIKAVMTTNNFEDCIKTVISYGGDSDSTAAMAGSIAGALYPTEVVKYEKQALAYLDDYLTNIYIDITKEHKKILKSTLK